jgi:hypothetical protein
LPGKDDSRNTDHFRFDVKTEAIFFDAFSVQLANVVAGWAALAAARLIQTPTEETGGGDRGGQMGSDGDRGSEQGKSENWFEVHQEHPCRWGLTPVSD